MTVTTFEGLVENGQIRLPPGIFVPDRTKVYIVIPEVDSSHRAKVDSPRLAHPEQARDFEKELIPQTPDARL